jgi:hypothetical protein
MPEPIFIKLDMYEYIMAPEPISVTYFIKPSNQSVYPSIVARQWPGKNVAAATNTHATIE